MDRADARASQDRVGRFDNHWEIDGDPVAFRVVALPNDRGLIAALVQMTINTVEAGVELAVLEPFDRNIARDEGSILYLGERLRPGDAFGLIRPELVGVLQRRRVHFLVLGLVHEGVRLPLRGHIINLVRHRHFLPAHPYAADGYSFVSGHYATASARPTSCG